MPSSSSRTLRPPGSTMLVAGQPLDGGSAGQRADGLLGAADLAASAGQVDVGAAQLRVHVARRDAKRQQPVRVERHADLAVDAADALDLRHARARPAARVTILSSMNHDSSSSVICGARRRVGDDGHGGDVDALKIGSSMVRGSSHADARDGVLHVVERAVGVGLKLEFDGRGGGAIGEHRGHVLHANHADDGVLDTARHLGFQLGRGGARPA